MVRTSNTPWTDSAPPKPSVRCTMMLCTGGPVVSAARQYPWYSRPTSFFSRSTPEHGSSWALAREKTVELSRIALAISNDRRITVLLKDEPLQGVQGDPHVVRVVD